MQLKRNMIRDNISWCEVNRAGQTKQNLKNLTHTKHLFAAGEGGGEGGGKGVTPRTLGEFAYIFEKLSKLE